MAEIALTNAPRVSGFSSTRCSTLLERNDFSILSANCFSAFRPDKNELCSVIFLTEKITDIVETEIFLYGSTVRIRELDIYFRPEMCKDFVNVGQTGNHFGSHRLILRQLFHQ